MTRDVLIVAARAALPECARSIAEQLGTAVEVVVTRKAGLQALGQAEFGVVVIEESMIEGDSAWADEMWDAAGLAITIQVNFGICGCARLGREIKAALQRRQGEQRLARRSVVRAIEDELRSSVTGLLLESEMALAEPALPAALKPKLEHLVELARILRERLEGATERLG